MKVIVGEREAEKIKNDAIAHGVNLRDAHRFEFSDPVKIADTK